MLFSHSIFYRNLYLSMKNQFLQRQLLESALCAAVTVGTLGLVIDNVAKATSPVGDDLVSVKNEVSMQEPVVSLSVQLEDAYILGAGDTIAIDVFNVPEYSGTQRVLADGSVNLPAIGPVNVKGLTPQEAGARIAIAYQSELRYPQVTVVIEAARPLRVAVSGEVGNPGVYTLDAEQSQLPTVSQALQAAGGVTQAADLRQIKVRRANGQRPSQTIALDLWELINSGDVQQDLALRDGDAIVVGSTDYVDIAESNRLSASNLASSAEEEILVAVVGEVFRPGAYKFEGSSDKSRTTVTQAVQSAGGVKPTADIRNIQVRRSTRNGNDQIIDLNFWELLQAGDFSQDLVLQQGDTVVIPEASESTPSEIAQITAANFSPNEVNVNVVGEVAAPGRLQVSPNTTLNQAVLAAGGFTRRATETVELIRLNPNGTVTQRQIEVSLDEGIDEERNPIILNNDVVTVGRNGRARVSDTIEDFLGPFIRVLNPLRILF